MFKELDEDGNGKLTLTEVMDSLQSELEEEFGDEVPAGDAAGKLLTAVLAKLAIFFKILQIFGGLVFGCIRTKFCKKICV